MSKHLWICVLLLHGCVGMGMQGLTPEQIKAAANVRDVNALCLKVAGPWGTGVTTFLSVDQKVIPKDGTVGVTDACQIAFSQNQPAPVQPAGINLVPAITVTPMTVTPMTVVPTK